MIPLLSLERTALLAVSTSAGSDNFYSKLIKLKDEAGRPVFHSIQFSLICDECRRGKRPEDCTHLVDTLPPWLSGGKVEKIKAMLESDPALFMRETMGECADGADKVFRAEWVERLRAAPRAPIPAAARHVFVAVDPAGGGVSQFSVVSVVRDGPRVLLVGIEGVATKDVDEVEALLVEHLRRLRASTRLWGARLVLAIESNLGYESDRLYRAVVRAGIRDAVPMRDDDEGRVGLRTDHARKAILADALADALAAGGVALADEIVSRDARKHCEDLFEQLENYSRIVEPARTEFGRPRATYSGKMYGNDDLCICLQFAVAYSSLFLRDPRYRAVQ